MPSQLVALATQARNAPGLETLELDDLDEELPDPHIPIRASLQLALPFELVREVDVAKQVPHLAMMLLTAFSQIADDDEIDDGQPVTNRRDSTTPAKARFIPHPHEKLSAKYSAALAGKASQRSYGDGSLPLASPGPPSFRGEAALRSPASLSARPNVVGRIRCGFRESVSESRSRSYFGPAPD
jgi:hypothetical protein